jgi:hypothetical protein
MKQNILLYLDTDREDTLSLKSSASSYSFISYHVPGDNATAMVTDTLSADNTRLSLSTKLKHQFKEMEVQSK